MVTAVLAVSWGYTKATIALFHQVYSQLREDSTKRNRQSWRKDFQSWAELCGICYTLVGHLASNHFLSLWLNKSEF